MTQSTIFDQVEKQKQEGMELVYRHANTLWQREAATTLLEVAQTMRHFTSDDILIPLERRGITTGDYRAIAAILQSACRMGLIRSTDKFIRCRRKTRHGAPVMVWQSNLKIQENNHE